MNTLMAMSNAPSRMRYGAFLKELDVILTRGNSMTEEEAGSYGSFIVWGEFTVPWEIDLIMDYVRIIGFATRGFSFRRILFSSIFEDEKWIPIEDTL